MTTIAYKDGVIASDSRRTQGDTIITDDYDKIYKRGDSIFALSGVLSDVQIAIDTFLGLADKKDADVSGIAYHENILYFFSFNDEKGIWVNEHEPDICYAIGSGRDHALTAMDMGATAKEAVKYAMKRDICTGGKIKTVKLW